MADLFGQYESNLRGGADKWDDGPAGVILLADYFASAPEPPAETVYVGASSRAVRYLGTRSDAQIYFGAGALFP